MQCVHVPNQGFKRGSYICQCKKGYYFPNHQAKTKHFTGESVEAAYDAMLNGTSNGYKDEFECLACSPGCSECVDSTPCIFSSNLSIRVSLACINVVMMMVAAGFGFAVCIHHKHKVCMRLLIVTSHRIINNGAPPAVNLYSSATFQSPK